MFKLDKKKKKHNSSLTLLLTACNSLPAWTSSLHLLFICLLFQMLLHFVLILYEDNNMIFLFLQHSDW